MTTGAAGPPPLPRAGAPVWISALATALLIVAAAPPFNLWPLALVALVPFLLSARALTPIRLLSHAWICGFLVNIAGHSWGVTLLARLAGVSRPTGILWVISIATYQAAVFPLWLGAADVLRRRFQLPFMVTAPLCIVCAESLIPFIFPWYLGIGVWRAWPLTQIAELGGPPAVSALVVLINLVVVELLLSGRQPSRAGRIGALVALAIVSLGLARAAQVAHARRASPSLRVAIVQPNFGIVSIEDRQTHGESLLAELRRATTTAGAAGAQLVVWPESSFPFLFDRNLRSEFAPGHPWELRGEYRGPLLLGALTHDFRAHDERAYNSALLIGGDGKLRGRYDKNRLLAFGEFIPFADRFPDWANHLRERMPDSPQLEAGQAPTVLSDGALRVGPLICYEDLLPDFVAEVARARPNLLVTLANHAWFGDSSAPELALALATLRSVETRRDLVRATNTGISSIGDALGRVLSRTALRDSTRPGTPELLLGEVRLIEQRAAGPWLAPLFPFACALGLLALLLRRRDVEKLDQ